MGVKPHSNGLNFSRSNFSFLLTNAPILIKTELKITTTIIIDTKLKINAELENGKPSFIYLSQLNVMPPDYKGLKKSKFLVQITLEHIGDTRIA